MTYDLSSSSNLLPITFFSTSQEGALCWDLFVKLLFSKVMNTLGSLNLSQHTLTAGAVCSDALDVTVVDASGLEVVAATPACRISPSSSADDAVRCSVVDCRIDFLCGKTQAVQV